MTMEWLVLVLLVPAILVPVVLLWGFAGCSFDPNQPRPDPPTNVRADGISVSAIRLTWNNPSTDDVTFQVERTKEGESVPQILAASSTTIDDAGLNEATTYFYQVRVIRTWDNERSDLSEQAAGRTIGVAFEALLTTDQDAHEGFTVVQRIEPARLRQRTLPGDLLTPGARVRITVPLHVRERYAGPDLHLAVSGVGRSYDSAADLTQVQSGVVVPANTAVILICRLRPRPDEAAAHRV